MVGELWDRFLPLWKAAKDMYQKPKEMKATLGSWYTKAYDKHTHEYMCPDLNRDRFEAYLVNSKGVLQPKGDQNATARWSYLLHSLGITPDKETPSGEIIITWKPPKMKINEPGIIHLEMGG